MTRVRLIIIGLILSGIVLSGALFAVDETEFAVITRFGEIQHVEYSPGLKVKTPFIDRVIRLDNRLLHIDVPTATMPDVQKQNLEIDAYVRYRIIDPEKFLRRLNQARRSGIGAVRRALPYFLILFMGECNRS